MASGEAMAHDPLMTNARPNGSARDDAMMPIVAAFTPEVLDTA